MDDDRDVADYVQHEGHVVTLCHDGAEALRLGERHAFDIFVLDVMMPAWTDSR